MITFYLLIISACLHLTPVSLQDDAPKSCPADVIPGIERMARGIDITKLDLHALRDDGFRNTLIEFTCNDENRKWSMGGVDKEFWKTDQVAGANPHPGGTMVSETTISETSEDVKDSMAASVSLSVDTLFGGFSASSSVKMSEESKFKKNSIVAEVKHFWKYILTIFNILQLFKTLQTSAFVSAIQVDFYLPQELWPSLSKSFTNFFSGPVLPYANNSAKYDNFVDTFGTHYFGHASLGGFMNMKTVITEELYSSSSSSELEVKLEANYRSIVSAGAEYNKQKEKNGEAFNKNTKITFAYLGGDPISLELDSEKPNEYLAEWTKTVLEKPHLFEGRLRGIEELVANEDLRIEVKKAIRIHMTRAYLEEILRVFKLVKMEDRLGDMDSLRGKIINLKTEDQFKEVEVALKKFMYYVLLAVKEKPRLARMLKGWSSSQLDVADCRKYIADACSNSNRTSRSSEDEKILETETKLDEEVQEFAKKAESLLADLSWENYTECRELIAEGRKLTVALARPLEGCKNSTSCNACRRSRAERAVHFCQSPEAMDVVVENYSMNKKAQTLTLKKLNVDKNMELNQTEVGAAIQTKYRQLFGLLLQQ